MTSRPCEEEKRGRQHPTKQPRYACLRTRLLRHLKNAGDWGRFRPPYVYVGASIEQSTKNAKKRPNIGIRKHIRENKCYSMFVGINKLDKRDRIEREQIAKYKPECNRNRGIVKRKYGE